MSSFSQFRPQSGSDHGSDPKGGKKYEYEYHDDYYYLNYVKTTRIQNSREKTDDYRDEDGVEGHVA